MCGMIKYFFPPCKFKSLFEKHIPDQSGVSLIVTYRFTILGIWRTLLYASASFPSSSSNQYLNMVPTFFIVSLYIICISFLFGNLNFLPTLMQSSESSSIWFFSLTCTLLQLLLTDLTCDSPPKILRQKSILCFTLMYSLRSCYGTLTQI